VIDAEMPGEISVTRFGGHSGEIAETPRGTALRIRVV